MENLDCSCSSWPQEAFWVPWPPPPVVAAAAEMVVPPPYRFHGNSVWPIPIDGVEEDRAATASRSHSLAEKRRRDRINSQLATLRKLIPQSEKMDKAALLGSVVDHVKDLKRKALEVSQASTIPSEQDEIIVDCDTHDIDAEKENVFIKASLCCDDQPELFSELTQALNGLRLSTVKADMACLGGRIKTIFVFCTKNTQDQVCIGALKRSLKVVLTRIAASSMASNSHTRSKRQRVFMPSHIS